MGGKDKVSRAKLLEQLEGLELQVQYLSAQLRLARSGQAERDSAPRRNAGGEPGSGLDLNEVLANLPGLAYRCRNDADWSPEFVSAGCQELTGYSPEEFLTRLITPAGDVIAPQFREQVRREIGAALDEHRRFKLRYAITTKTGETKWIWEQGGGIYGPDGALQALEGLILDASDLHLAQQSLARRNAQLFALNQLSQALSAAADLKQLKGVLSQLKDGFEQLSSVALLLFSVEGGDLELVHETGHGRSVALPARLTLDRGITGRCARLGRSQIVNDTRLDPDFFDPVPDSTLSEAAFALHSAGHLLGVLNFDSPLPDAFDEELTAALSAIAQQTAVVLERIRLLDDLRSELAQRRQAEFERASMEQLMAAVVEQSPLGITVRDPGGRLLQANEAWLKFWNVDSERLDLQQNLPPEIFQSAILNFFGPEHGARIMAVHQQGGYLAVDEIEFDHPQAGHRWMAFKCYSLQRLNGGVDRVVSITEDITERRLAEKGRAAAEQLMASAFQHSPIGVTIRSGSGSLLFCNSSWREIWGVDDAELEYQQELDMSGTLDMLTNTFGEQTAREVARLLEQGGSLGINEVRWERFGDPQDIRWLDVLFFSVKDESGAISNLVTITSDVTDKQVSELRLQQNEKQLRQIIDLVPHFIFAKDAEGRFLLANEAVAEAYGCSLLELIGKCDADFDPDFGEVEHFRADDLEVIRTQRAKLIPEETITDAGGRRRYLQTTKIPFQTLADEAPAVLGVSIDITERKLALEALRESEERWQFALEGAGDGVWDCNYETGQTYFSARFKTMLGYDEDEELDGSLAAWRSTIHPDDIASATRESERHFSGESPTYVSEHRIRCKDGSYKWILDRGKAIRRAEDGQPLRVIGTHTDISGLKAVQKDLEDFAGWQEQAEGIGKIGSWDWEIEGNRIRWSKYYYTLMGYAPFSVEPSVERYNSHVHPEDLSRLQEIQADPSIPREASASIHRIITTDGEIKWVQHSARELRDESGRLRLRGITQDITERMQAEAELQSRAAALLESQDNLRRRNEELRLINLLSERLSAVESLADLGKVLEADLLVPFRLTNLGLLLADDESRTLSVALNLGLYSDTELKTFRPNYGEGLMGRCALVRQPVVCNDTIADPDFYELIPGSIRSEAAFPLIVADRLLGVLNLDSPEPGSFAPEQVEALSAIARQVIIVVERVRLTEELRKSEEHLRAVVDTAIDAIITINEQGEMESFNRSAERIFGYSAAEAIGQSVRMLMPEAAEQACISGLRGFLAAGQARVIGRGVEVPGLRRDGSLLPLELVVQEMQIGGERRILGMLRDISGRKEVQLALEQSETRYRQLFEENPVAMYTVDTQELRFTSANTAALKRYGYSLDEILHLTLFDIRPPDDRERLASTMPIALRSNGYQGIWRHQSRDGKLFDVEIFIQCLNFGGVDSRLVIANDVTDRLRAEVALRESEERLRALMEYSSDMVSITDRNGVIKFEAPAVRRILGYAPEELVGTNAFDLIHPDDVALALSAFVSGAEEPGASGSVEYRARHAAGHYVFLESIGANRLDVPGIDGMVIYTRDISDRKRAEEERRKLEAQIQHAQKLESLGVLAGGIAHDFNNLLVGIMGNAGLALLDLPPESPARSTLQQIETGALRAAELTRQMLAYSGKGKFIVQPINLSRAVEEMAHLLQTVISKKADLRFDFADDLPAVEADATQVRQVVMNLITNASDALGERSGAITIRTGLMQADQAYLQTTLVVDGVEPGDFAFVEVVDTGVGMDTTTIKRIFDPFFSTKFTGRGLGLAAVLGILRGHRGTIKVYSEPGRGTTFKVLFPCTPLKVVGHGPGLPLHSNWRGSGTILVVDDDESVRAVARSILVRAGFKVIMASDGAEGLELCRSLGSELSCVLVDLTMPNMSGEELFRLLRVEGIGLPVVLMSGYSEQEVIPQFQGKGLSSFVQKPFGPFDLIGALKAALEGAELPAAGEDEAGSEDAAAWGDEGAAG